MHVRHCTIINDCHCTVTPSMVFSRRLLPHSLGSWFPLQEAETFERETTLPGSYGTCSASSTLNSISNTGSVTQKHIVLDEERLAIVGTRASQLCHSSIAFHYQFLSCRRSDIRTSHIHFSYPVDRQIESRHWDAKELVEIWDETDQTRSSHEGQSTTV